MMNQDHDGEKNPENVGPRNKKKNRDRKENSEESSGSGQEIYSKKMWFWHILTPKQNKFLDSSVNSNKFLFEMEGTIQPIRNLKINLKTHKGERIWNASWNSSSDQNNNTYRNNDNEKDYNKEIASEKEKAKEIEVDHNKLRKHSQISFGILESISNPIEHVSVGRTWSCDRWLFRVNGSLKANRDDNDNGNYKNNTSNTFNSVKINISNNQSGDNSQKNTPSKRKRRWGNNNNFNKNNNNNKNNNPDIAVDKVSDTLVIDTEVRETVIVEHESNISIDSDLVDNLVEDTVIENNVIEDPLLGEEMYANNHLISSVTTTATRATLEDSNHQEMLFESLSQTTISSGDNNNQNTLFNKLFASANLGMEFVTSTWYKNTVPPFSVKIQNNYTKCLNTSVKLEVQFPHDKDTKALMLGGTYNIQRHFYSGRAYYCWNKKSCIGITSNHHLSWFCFLKFSFPSNPKIFGYFEDFFLKVKKFTTNLVIFLIVGHNTQKQKFQSGLHLSWNY